MTTKFPPKSPTPALPVSRRFFHALEILREKMTQLGLSNFSPCINLQLGSGWDLLLQNPAFKVLAQIPFSNLELPSPDPTIGHAGEFLFAELGGKPLLVTNGRLHRYDLEITEKYICVCPVWLALKLGCSTFVLTNAAGGISQTFAVGEIVSIKDHVTWGFDPLDGIPRGLFSELKFNGMNEVYSQDLRAKLISTFSAAGLPITEGVYFQLPGPSFETPALIRCLETCGADLVGMSTAQEASCLHAAGAKVLGVSCVTNIAATEGKPAPNHLEVQEALAKAKGTFEVPFVAFLETLSLND